jgi:2-keto-4-pentenoate hydratase/2-oxohepta-3-ene-1,7-dioic acid hydratase in catechol pathway
VEDAVAPSHRTPRERVIPLSAVMSFRQPQSQSLLSLFDQWDSHFQALAIACESLTPELKDASLDITELHAHAPFVPRQIFCTIANYRSHILEVITDAGGSVENLFEDRLRGSPYACFKLPSTVIGPTDPLQIPRHVQRLDWELELGVVMGKHARRVSREEAMTYVAGYVMTNDITARDQVRRTDVPNMGTDWLQSKNAPGFLPLGPYFVPAAFIPDPYHLRLNLSLNDRHMQDGVVSDMLFDIATQIEYISQHAQLLPGDVICTGTPAGCGMHYKRFLQPGDVMHASIPGLGTQHTACVAEPLPS